MQQPVLALFIVGAFRPPECSCRAHEALACCLLGSLTVMLQDLLRSGEKLSRGGSVRADSRFDVLVPQIIGVAGVIAFDRAAGRAYR